MAGIIIRTEARTADAERNLNRLSESVKNVDKSSRSTAESVTQMLKVIGMISGATLGLRFVQNLASEFQFLENRIANVVGRTRELAVTQRELLAISERTASSLENTVRLYGSMGRALRDQGASNRRLLEVTETIQKAITISGAEAITARAAIIQLGQGLSSGTLRGEELNSVMENTPRIAQAIADNLGVSLGNLRLLAAQGKLTSDVVFTALVEQAKNINKEFTQIQPTINQATALLIGNLRLVIFEFTKGLRIFERLADIYSNMARRLINVTDQAFLFGNAISIVYFRTKIFFNEFNDSLIKPVIRIIKEVTNAFLQMVPSVKVTFAIKNWFIRFARTFDETVLFGLVQFFKKLEFAALFKFESDLEKAVRRLRRLSPRYWIGTGFNRATLEKLFSVSTLREFGGALSDIANSIGNNQNSIAARFERLSISVGFATQAISRFFGFRPDTFITLKRGGFEPLFKSLSEIVRGTVRTSRYFWELSGIIKQILYPSIVILFKDIYRSTIPILNFIGKSIQTLAKIIWTAVKLIYQVFDDLTSVFAGKEVIYHFSSTTNKLISKAKEFSVEMLESLFPKTIEQKTRSVVERIAIIIQKMSLKIRDFGDLASVFAEKDIVQQFVSLSKKLIDSSKTLSRKLLENLSPKQFQSKIKGVVKGLADIFQELLSKIGRSFSKDTTQVLVKNLKDELEDLRVDLLKTSKSIVQILSKTLKEILNKTLNFSINPNFDFGVLYSELKESIKKLSKVLLELLLKTFERSQKIFVNIGKIFWDAFAEGIGKDLRKKLSNAANDLKRFAETIIKYFKDLYIRVIGNSYWTDTIERIVSDSNTLWNRSSKGIENFKKNFINTFKFIEKTKAGYEFKEIKITDQTSFQIPTARVGTLFYATIEAAGKLVDTIIAAIYTIPEQIKLALLGLTGLIALVLFPDSTFKNAFLLLILGAILRNSSKVGEAFSQALTGESVFNKVGRFLGNLAGRFVVEFVRNIPTLINAVTSVVSEFSKAFLAQIPILGKVTTGLFAAFAALGLGPTSGLLIAWLFGKSITSFMSSIEASKKKVGKLTKLFQGLHARFVLGQGWGLLGTIIFGKFGVNTGALLALVLDFFGSFNSLFTNSPLMHMVARGGLLYLLFTGRSGLTTITKKITEGILKAFSFLIPKIYGLLGLSGGLQLDLFGAIQLSNFEQLKFSLISLFTAISNSIVSVVAPFIQSKWNFIRTLFLGKDPARTVADIKNVFLDIYSVIRSTFSNSSLFRGVSNFYQGLKRRAGEFVASQKTPPAETFSDYKARIAKELKYSRMAYVRSFKGPAELRDPARAAFEAAKAKQAEVLSPDFAFNFRKQAAQSANLATKIGGETGLLGRLMLGKAGKFVIGGTVLAALALFSSNVFAADSGKDNLDRLPNIFERFSKALIDFTENHPIFKFLTKLAVVAASVAAILIASIRSVTTGASAKGIFGSLGAIAGGYIAYGITESIESAITTAIVGGMVFSSISGVLSTFIGKALQNFLGNFAKGSLVVAVAKLALPIAGAFLAALAAAFAIGAGISFVKNFLFGRPGQLKKEMKSDWDAVKEYFLGTPESPVIDSKGLKAPQLKFLQQQKIKVTYDLSEVNTDRLKKGQAELFKKETDKFKKAIKEAREKELLGEFDDDSLRLLESQVKRFERIVERMRRASAINFSDIANEIRKGSHNLNKSRVDVAIDRIKSGLEQPIKNSTFKLLASDAAYYYQVLSNIPKAIFEGPSKFSENWSKALSRRKLPRIYDAGDPGIEYTARMLESVQNLRYEHPFLQKELEKTATRYAELSSRMQENIRLRDRKGTGISARAKAIAELEEQLKLQRTIENLSGRLLRFEEQSATIAKFQRELSSLTGSLNRAKINVNLDELVISEKNFKTLRMFGKEAERIYEDLEKTQNIEERTQLVLRLRTVIQAAEDAINDNLLDDFNKDNFQLKDKVSSILSLDLADSFYANLDEDRAKGFLARLIEIEKLQRRMAQKPIPYMFGVGPTEDMAAAGYFETTIRRTLTGATEDLDAPIPEFPNTPFFQRIGRRFSKIEIIPIKVQLDEVPFNILEQRIQGIKDEILKVASEDFKGFLSALESLGVNGQIAFERLGLEKTAEGFFDLMMATSSLNNMLSNIAESKQPITQENLNEIVRLWRLIANLRDELNREPITLDVAIGNVNTLGFSFDKKNIAGLSNDDIQLIKVVSEEVDRLTRELTNLKDGYDANSINAYNKALEENRRKLEAIYLQTVKNNKFANIKSAGVSGSFEQSLLTPQEADEILEAFVRIKLLTDELNAGTDESRRNYSKNLQEVARQERLQEVRLSAISKKTFGGTLGLVNEVFSTAFNNLDFSKFTSKTRESLGSIAFFLKTALEDAIKAGGEGIRELSEITKNIFDKLNLVQSFKNIQERIKDLYRLNSKEALDRINEISGIDIELEAYLTIPKESQVEFEKFLEKANFLEELNLKRNLEEIAPGISARLEELSLTGDIEYIYSTLAKEFEHLFENLETDPQVLLVDALAKNSTNLEDLTAALINFKDNFPTAFEIKVSNEAPGAFTPVETIVNPSVVKKDIADNVEPAQTVDVEPYNSVEEAPGLFSQFLNKLIQFLPNKVSTENLENISRDLNQIVLFNTQNPSDVLSEELSRLILRRDEVTTELNLTDPEDPSKIFKTGALSFELKNLELEIANLSSKISFLNSISAYATGGSISGPGTGTSDSILARVSNGEFIVNANSTRKHRELIEQINADKLPKFAKGGIIPSFYTGGIASIVNQDPLYQKIIQLNSDPDFLKLSVSERNKAIAELTDSKILRVPGRVVPSANATLKPATTFMDKPGPLAPGGNSYVQSGYYARNPNSPLANQSFHGAVGKRISENLGIRPNQHTEMKYLSAKIAQHTSGDKNFLFTRHPTSRHTNDLRAPLSRRVIDEINPETNTTYNKVIQRFSAEYDDTRQFRRTLDRKFVWRGWDKLGVQFKDMGKAVAGQVRHAPVSSATTLAARIVVGSYIDDWMRDQLRLREKFDWVADELEGKVPLPARAMISATGAMLEEGTIASIQGLTGRGAFVGTKMLGRIPAMDRIKALDEVRKRFKYAGEFSSGGLIEKPEDEDNFFDHLMSYGKGLKTGFSNQIEGILAIAMNPIEFGKGLMSFGKQLYDEPIDTVSNVFSSVKGAVVDAFESPEAMGRFIGENVNVLGKLNKTNKIPKSNLDVFHGTANKFDKFDDAFLGSQHGQLYGKGHYFTNRFEDAKYWAKAATPIKYIDEMGNVLSEDTSRFIYKVRLDDAMVNNFIDFDNIIPKFTRQGLIPRKHPLQSYLREIAVTQPDIKRHWPMYGREVVPGISFLDEPQKMIENLQKHGIHGVKHQFGSKTHYIVFEGKNAPILDSRKIPFVDLPNYPQFNTGGLIKGPGTGTSDSILARVSNGEAIINAEATRKHWPLLKEINEGRELPAFQAGRVPGTAASRNYNTFLLEEIKKQLELASASQSIFAEASLLGSISGAELSMADAVKIKFEDLVDIADLQRKAADAKIMLQKAKITGDPQAIVAAQKKYEDAIRNASDAIAIALEDFAERINQASKDFASDMTSEVRETIGKVLKEGKFDTKTLATNFSHKIIDLFVEGLTEPFRQDFENVMKGLGKEVISFFTKGLKKSEETPTEESKEIPEYIRNSAPYQIPEVEAFSKVKDPTVTGTSEGSEMKEYVTQPMLNSLAGLGAVISVAGMKQNNTLMMILGFIPTIIALLGAEKVNAAVSSFSGFFAGGFASGGLIKGPGTGTSDSIPALLSNGEYIINAKSAKDNLQLLSAINSNSIKKFADGGLVSDVGFIPPSTKPIKNEADSSSSSQQMFNINITGDVSRQTRSEIMQMIPQLAGGINAYNREINYKR